MASTEQLPRLSHAYIENSNWLLEHLDEVVSKFPNQWVAVWDKKVIAANADLGAVRDAVGEALDSGDTVFHFVDDGSMIFTVGF